MGKIFTLIEDLSRVYPGFIEEISLFKAELEINTSNEETLNILQRTLFVVLIWTNCILLSNESSCSLISLPEILMILNNVSSQRLRQSQIIHVSHENFNLKGLRGWGKMKDSIKNTGVKVLITNQII